MIAVVSLEVIGDDHETWWRYCNAGSKPYWERRYANRPRAWVARLTGLDRRGAPVREWMRGRKDYAEANRAGSRGVYRWYELPEWVYEVNAPLDWERADRYYARSAAGKLERMTKDEVIAWIRDVMPTLTYSPPNSTSRPRRPRSGCSG